MYDEGNFVEGKAEMYDVMDNYYLSEQQYYELPIVVTEWGSDGINGGEVVKDEFAYFIEHNWGSSYWAWFRAGPVGDAYNMGLLCDDWETPSNSGEAFKQKLAELD